MIQAYYETYYDKETNFKNTHKIRTRLNDENKANQIIGLNLVYSSFQMIKANIKDGKKGDETFRISQAVNVSLGLNGIIENIFHNHYKTEELVEFLNVNIKNLAKTLPRQKLNEYNIPSHHLYELAAIFYSKSKRFESLGNRVYIGLSGDVGMRSLLDELQTIEGKIHKYESDHLDYPNLLGMIDGIKARIFRQEESIMRLQLMQELGLEF